MEFKKSNLIPNNEFEQISINTELKGIFKGFSFTDKYIIGSCELFDFSQKSDDGYTVLGSVKFILEKKPNTSLLTYVFEKYKKKKGTIVKLKFKGISKKGNPFFNYEFS